MTLTLLIVALSSLMLGLLFWGAVRLLGARPHSQSALLVMAALSLICFPAVVVVSANKSDSDVKISNVPVDPELIDEIPVTVDSVYPLAPDSAVDQGVSEPVALTSKLSADPVIKKAPLSIDAMPEEAHADLAAQLDDRSLESVANSFEILIPAAVNKILPYLGILWVVGAGICGVKFLWQCMIFQRNTRYHRSLEDENLNLKCRSIAEDLGIKRLPELVCSDEPSPYCYGIIRRRLHLPSTWLENSSDDEISMILQHELQHIRQHDLALLMLQLPVRIFYWWNPLVTRLMKHLDYVRETLCDRAASEGSPESYAHLLLQFASSPSPSNQTVMAMASSSKVMEARIKNLYTPVKRDRKMTGLACATIVSGMTALVLTNVHIEAAQPPSGDSDNPPTAKTAKEAIHRILHAEVNQRTRVAAELDLPNNPVTTHYEQYQQAKKELSILLAKGHGVKHPTVIAKKRTMQDHLRHADQSVFELLLVLQKQNPQKPKDLTDSDDSEKQPAPVLPMQHGEDAAIEDPRTFYPGYLKKLNDLPADKRLAYAAALPISNNPALIHNIEKQTLESGLHDGLASGLGLKHPYVRGLQQRLEIYDKEYAQAALKITIGILENQDKKPPGSIILKLFVQRREVSRLRAEGLGYLHPDIIMREQYIESLEQKIDDWNQNEKNELEDNAE